MRRYSTAGSDELFAAWRAVPSRARFVGSVGRRVERPVFALEVECADASRGAGYLVRSALYWGGLRTHRDQSRRSPHPRPFASAQWGSAASVVGFAARRAGGVSAELCAVSRASWFKAGLVLMRGVVRGVMIVPSYCWFVLALKWRGAFGELGDFG